MVKHRCRSSGGGGGGGNGGVNGQDGEDGANHTGGGGGGAGARSGGIWDGGDGDWNRYGQICILTKE